MKGILNILLFSASVAVGVVQRSDNGHAVHSAHTRAKQRDILINVKTPEF